MIVDEAQNLTPHEVKTIITRVGEATKIVLTGDPYQIDNPYVDASYNGLTTVVERFKGEVVAGHVTLSKGERSQLAELASNVLCRARSFSDRPGIKKRWRHRRTCYVRIPVWFGSPNRGAG